MYARPTFTNAYGQLLKDLDLLFNTSLKTYKSSSSKGNLTDEELWQEFEVYRRKRMEDSIARMRQLSVYSNVIIQPEGVVEKKIGVGSRPNFNVDFTAKKTFSMSPKKDK